MVLLTTASTWIDDPQIGWTIEDDIVMRSVVNEHRTSANGELSIIISLRYLDRYIVPTACVIKESENCVVDRHETID